MVENEGPSPEDLGIKDEKDQAREIGLLEGELKDTVKALDKVLLNKDEVEKQTIIKDLDKLKANYSDLKFNGKSLDIMTPEIEGHPEYSNRKLVDVLDDIASVLEGKWREK
ncbi:MAG: hypothetical protein WC663_04335 [Patescibacteria group bacterium]|jgi:hypothetical protein